MGRIHAQSVEATSGFEPLNRGFAVVAVAFADVR
jgi:hypothetical protein